MADDPDDAQLSVLRQEIERLRNEHRTLDEDILSLQSSADADQLQLQRLKKRKLALRDRIAFLEDQTTPDIIA